MNDRNGFRNQFDLITKQRTFLFRAKDQNTCEEWVKEIDNCIKISAFKQENVN